MKLITHALKALKKLENCPVFAIVGLQSNEFEEENNKTNMANKLFVALLGLLCLVPTYYAAPASNESSEEITKGFVERIKWAILALTEFTDLYNDILQQGPKILVEVLKDPKVTEVKTEAMEKETQVLKDFLEKFEKLKAEEKKENAFELVDKFDDVTEKFNSKNNDKLTPEAIIIETSMKEHGLLEVRKTVVSHFESFLTKFKMDVDTYLNGLTEKEKEEEKKFIEWYEKLNAEPDIDEKIEMLDKLFDDDDD